LFKSKYLFLDVVVFNHPLELSDDSDDSDDSLMTLGAFSSP